MKEELTTLFAPGERASPEEIEEQHETLWTDRLTEAYLGGSVEFHSSTPAGTTFTVHLPWRLDDAAKQGSSATAGSS